MKEYEVNSNLAYPIKALIVSMLLLIFLVVLMPLWNMGRDATLSVSTPTAAIVDTDAENRALKAAVTAALPKDSIQQIESVDFR